MDSIEMKNRLVGVGETLKAKGWESVSIDIFITYLAIFDLEPGPLDPMIFYRPSIRASVRDKHDIPTIPHEFVHYDRSKTLEQAMAKLEETATAMPTMAFEADRIEQAKAKLSDEDRRLLGIP